MQKFPFHFQNAIYDCVPTCVLALAEYYDVPMTLKQLRRILVVDPNLGTPIRNLLHLQPFFNVQLGKITNIEDLPTYFPFIAYLNRSHSVVVWSLSDNGMSFVVGDPGIGLLEMPKSEFFRQWDGLTAIIRPLQEQPQMEKKQQSAIGALLQDWRTLRQTIQSFAGINWLPMLWLSLIITILGIANSYYSLAYANYLQDFWKFITLVCTFTAITGLLSWIVSVIQARLTLRFSQEIGWRIRDALPLMDKRFYTMGDISTRYQDAATVISAIMGLYRDIPYAVMIFGASIYFLCKVSWLLGIFVLAFLLLLISILSPFVEKVQNMNYTIKIKDAVLMDQLKNYLMGGTDDVNTAYEETLTTRYKQSIWSIPISSTVGNSAVFPVLFVVVFLHWKTGGVSQYQELLSALMIMNYAVSAGHTLYGRYVAWKTALPSFDRLKDFLEIDQVEDVTGANVS